MADEPISFAEKPLLGVAWSQTLRDNPDILDMIDYVEMSGWQLDNDDDLPHQRIILHNLDLDWSLAHRDAIYPGWQEKLHAAIERCRTPWFSVHLGFASEEVRFDYHMLPVSPPLDRDVLLQRVIDNLRAAGRLCPVPLLVENLDYCPEGAYNHVCDPGFIREAVTEAGPGLLLDLSHLQVSASWLGSTPKKMLDALPLERVVELHITSPRPLGDEDSRLDDGHYHLQPRDYDLLGEVLSRCTPQAITLEYNRDAGLLREQIAGLREFLDQ